MSGRTQLTGPYSHGTIRAELGRRCLHSHEEAAHSLCDSEVYFAIVMMLVQILGHGMVSFPLSAQCRQSNGHNIG
jgi:hypothetical protein